MSNTVTRPVISPTTGKPKKPNVTTAEADLETSCKPDPFPGCGCGHNCTRNPGDACPIAVMACFEVVFPGFDGSTDKTDNLIKWVKASAVEHVAAWLIKHYPQKALDCKIVDMESWQLSFADGVDAVLDNKGDVWLGEVTDVDPHYGSCSSLGKLGDKMRLKRMSHLRAATVIRYLDPRPITAEEWSGLRMNSYEMKLLYSKLDNTALIGCVENHLKNCRQGSPYDPAGSYDEAIVQDFAPLLLERLKASVANTSSVDTLAKRIEVGLVNPLQDATTTVTIDLGLSLLFGITLDKGQELKGPELVFVLMANAYDYLGHLLSGNQGSNYDGEYDDTKFPGEDGIPDHWIDFDVVDAYRDDQGPPPVKVDVSPRT